ncbi:MAG: hypothetical protein H7Z11_10105 [Verrucomicrobia bacterium]|nr:hypothetical protein [Leptolyngbya sp. ES-bin-22]
MSLRSSTTNFRTAMLMTEARVAKNRASLHIPLEPSGCSQKPGFSPRRSPLSPQPTLTAYEETA